MLQEFLALFIFVSFGYAADKPIGFPCAPQVYRLLTDWKVESWETSSPAAQKPLKGITQDNESLELDYDSQRSKLTLISATGITKVTLALPACARSLNFTPGSPRFHGKVFNEDDLNALLNKSKKSRSKTILIFWSPGMPLSVRAREELSEIATLAQVEVIPLADPNSPRLAPTDQTFSAESFYERGVMNHFPSFLFVKNGKILGPPQYGWKEKPRMLSLIEREFRK